MKYSILIILLASLELFSQNPTDSTLTDNNDFIIQELSGVIIDNETKRPIRNATVFFNRTSLGSTTNQKGEFLLTNLPTGFIELVASAPGYSLYKSTMRIDEDKHYTLKLSLQIEDKKENNLLSSRNKKIKHLTNQVVNYLSDFKNCQGSCKILNMDKLKFFEKDEKIFVYAEVPILIENKLTGYTINYHLQPSIVDQENLLLHGFYWYELQQIINFDDFIQHEKNRLIAYLGSEQHFFSSFYKNTYEKEGFFLYNKDGKRFQFHSDTTSQSIKGYYKADLTDLKEIRYMPVTSINQLFQAIPERNYTINSTDTEILFSKSGVLFNQENNLFDKNLNDIHFLSSLPINYLPPVEIKTFNDISRFSENTYLHTSKNYYYPKDHLWFKAYINYNDISLLDSLSKVLYVELINSEKRILLSQMLEINDGQAFGTLQLPDQIEPGTYLLRAYTNWMRNYKDGFFEKTIPILSPEVNIIDETQKIIEVSNDFKVVIKPNQGTYSPRSKITIDAWVESPSGEKIAANLSVAVTNDSFIKDAHLINRLVKNKSYNTSYIPNKLSFNMENAINIEGILEDNKPEDVLIQFFNWEQMAFDDALAQQNGKFKMHNLHFYDSMEFNMLAYRKGKEFIPSIKLLPRDIPEINDFEVQNLNMVRDAETQTYNYYFSLEDAILLDEVAITANKVVEPKEKISLLPNADFTLKGNELNTFGGNLLMGLQGKVPGLLVNSSGPNPTLGFTRHGGVEPLVLINEIPASYRGSGFTAAQTLLTLDPNIIERIEIIRSMRGVIFFGEDASFGIIAIYTKEGGSSITEKSKSFGSLKLKGFSRYLPFKSPDYNVGFYSTKNDYRTTIYWNPSLILRIEDSKTSFSFFAADMPATYRILIEGFTQDGYHVRGIHYVTVVSN